MLTPCMSYSRNTRSRSSMRQNISNSMVMANILSRWKIRMESKLSLDTGSMIRTRKCNVRSFVSTVPSWHKLFSHAQSPVGCFFMKQYTLQSDHGPIKTHIDYQKELNKEQ